MDDDSDDNLIEIQPGDEFQVGFHHFGDDVPKVKQTEVSWFSLTYRSFGNLWAIDIPKKELKFLFLVPYKGARFPHNQGELGVLYTFRRIHHTLGQPFYRPGFEGLQFYKPTDYVWEDIKKIVTDLEFLQDCENQYWYTASNEYLDLEETHKILQTGFTIME
jgi:hypothetical protein